MSYWCYGGTCNIYHTNQQLASLTWYSTGMYDGNYPYISDTIMTFEYQIIVTHFDFQLSRYSWRRFDVSRNEKHQISEMST